MLIPCRVYSSAKASASIQRACKTSKRRETAAVTGCTRSGEMRARGGGGRGEESRGRRAGLSLDSLRLHWNIVEGEPSKSYHPTKNDWPFLLMFVFGNFQISVVVLHTTGASCHMGSHKDYSSVTKLLFSFSSVGSDKLWVPFPG